MLRHLRNGALLVLSLSVSLYGQQPPRFDMQATTAVNGGSVTGRVICADTQHAARFANVMLIPVEEGSSDFRDRGGRRSGARTDIDGNFIATNVQPGDYYVSAMATGYVSESALLIATGADTASALSKLPTVHVALGSLSTVNVSLERGAVISGRLQWDDGTPAAGVQVNAVTAAAQSGGQNGNRMFAFFGGMGGEFSQTDDRGQFRLTGLAPGSYFVRASVQTPVPADARGFSRSTSIVMYAPGKVRKTDAQTVTVRAGEERSDLSMVMDLTSLHRVSGHVGATSGTVASGSVRLVDSQDSSLSRLAQINADGSYTLSYVPAGTYNLSVPFASSTPGQMQRPPHGGDNAQTSSSGAMFQPFQEALAVTDTDLTGVDINLTPATQASK